jgi:enterochelin esterase family protein
MAVAESTGPRVSEKEVVFTFPDPRRRLRAVNLAQEVQRPRLGPPFARRGRNWELRLPRPDVDRMEYQLELVHRDGGREWINDPANTLRAAGPFGEKSVVEFPEYRPPAWLDEDAERGDSIPLLLPSRALRTDVQAIVWSSPGAPPGRPLPLLVVHDGPETARYASLIRLLEAAVAQGRLRPMRAALLHPVNRDQSYSASAAYARTLANELLPALKAYAPTPHRKRMRIGMGASLGALAMLHAHWNHRGVFGGLFLQSGSFFRARWDRHERGFVRFDRIARFVGKVLAGGSGGEPIPVTVTCGTVEENLANNRAVAAALAEQGYDVRLHVNRDAHNWVAWRDTFDPHLIELLRSKWG